MASAIFSVFRRVAAYTIAPPFGLSELPSAARSAESIKLRRSLELSLSTTAR
jgi:hypothetical protein